MNELELFAAAIDIGDPLERAALLDRECAGRPALRERLNELIQAHGRPNGLLDRSNEELQTIAVGPAKAAVGQIIAGRYKLLEEIGDGGMGTVWMAEQRSPVKRLVAVKLIKAGMDSKAVLARFEAERQALAVMDHPNIAKVLDAGTDEMGRPYFVMELVKGLSLMEYCDSRRLPVKDRLELFIQICSAIQHAHQKAVIHRDLKPSNVLVTEHDGKPVPKVIDFGLAKALGATNTLTDKTLHTAYGAVVGTPLYMAPEQVGINALDVDTRTDIYALGVILYELLTGSTPLEKARFKEAAWEEVKRLIREEEPPRPSTRLSSAQTLPSLAASRQVEPLQLRRLIRGELDWIVMKALEKDRSRRYETANGLARDIGRYLSDEAVEACPPTVRYRLWKFARKYRTVMTTAATIAILLIAGIAVSSWQAIRATRAEGQVRTSAESERHANQEAQRSAAAEKQANEQSQKRLARLQKGNEIITSIFDDLDIRKVKEGTEPLEAVLAKRLVKAAGQLEGDGVGDPLVVAELQYRVAASLLNLGQVQDATDLYIKARDTFAARWGPDHLDTIKTTRCIGDCYNTARKWKLAMPIWEDTVKRAKAVLGPDHYLTLVSISGLASCYMGDGKPELALPLLEENTALVRAQMGDGHLDTLNVMNNLAQCYKLLGKTDKAISTFEDAIKLQQDHIGAEHPDTIRLKLNLADCYADAGNFGVALPMMEEVLSLRKAKLGRDHPDTLNAMRLLGNAYMNAGKAELALPVLEESLQLSKTRLGPEDVDTLKCMSLLAQGYYRAGKIDLALPLMVQTLNADRATLGADHPDTLVIMNALGVCYWKLKQLDKSIRTFEELLAIQEKKLGRDDQKTVLTIANLGVNCLEAGRLKEAVTLLGEAHAASNNQEALRWVAQPLLRALIAAENFSAAAKLVDRELEGYGQQLPGSTREILIWADLMDLTSMGLIKEKQYAEAEPLIRASLTIREKNAPDAWRTFSTMTGVGDALLGQQKYADAELMLRKGYEGLKQRESTIAADGAVQCIPGVLDRLITVSTATKKPDDVKKWKAERAKYPEATTRPVKK